MHIVTDTMGNFLAVHVHAANIHDTWCGVFTFEKAFFTIRQLSEYVQIMFTGNTLKTTFKIFIISEWIFQKNLISLLKSYQNIGELNALFRGCIVQDAYQNTIKSELFMLNLWSLFLICIFYLNVLTLLVRVLKDIGIILVDTLY